MSTMAESFQDERRITQAMLAEYVTKFAALETARNELECVAREIAERLLCGEPAEPGPLSPEFDEAGNLQVMSDRR